MRCEATSDWWRHAQSIQDWVHVTVCNVCSNSINAFLLHQQVLKCWNNSKWKLTKILWKLMAVYWAPNRLFLETTDSNYLPFLDYCSFQQKYLMYEIFRGMPNDGADWTHLLRNNSMQVSVGLSRWVVVFPKKNEREAVNFIKTLLDAARSLRYPMAEPLLR